MDVAVTQVPIVPIFGRVEFNAHGQLLNPRLHPQLDFVIEVNRGREFTLALQHGGDFLVVKFDSFGNCYRAWRVCPSDVS
jgi:hypothetical protein